MVHPGTISNVRYLQRGRLESAQQLQRGWFREIIEHYGVDATYFRNNVSGIAKFINLSEKLL